MGTCCVNGGLGILSSGWSCKSEVPPGAIKAKIFLHNLPYTVPQLCFHTDYNIDSVVAFDAPRASDNKK